MSIHVWLHSHRNLYKLHVTRSQITEQSFTNVNRHNAAAKDANLYDGPQRTWASVRLVYSNSPSEAVETIVFS